MHSRLVLPKPGTRTCSLANSPVMLKRHTVYLAVCLVQLLASTEAFQMPALQKTFASCRRRSCRCTNRTISSDTALHMEPALIAGTITVAGAAAIIYLSGSEDRQRKAQYAEYEEKEKQIQEKRAQLAFIEPRDVWKEEELAQYDGSDPDGPILLGVDGTVFNVWKGRNFYGPGGEYHVMAGRDATRLLAKNSLEEDSEEDAMKPLNIAEKATLEGWYWIFKGKYEIVGKLEGKSTS
mmetsp:Transcript_32929/g.72642  ORF Transcript_32929/g.72642 Transcript_32929/m.72642 type:complete len:237 (-) Transcript_32929:59-769(-)